MMGWLLDNGLVVAVLAALLVAAGLRFAPFDLPQGGLPREPVPVDAIPDIGENQQIVFTEWPGRSPRDVEDQITYPLSSALLGMPGVRTVRSASAFGFSTIYVIFHDDVEFYWSRARVLEKLAALPPGTVPDGVRPALGPDATALGQVFWYTLEGRDPEGRTVGGFDPDELRGIQDWTVRYALQAVEGVSEVASVGGFVREYQVDVDPEALRANGVTLAQVANAVRSSNLDVGARTLEINGAEYVVRGLGFVRSLGDLEATVVVAREHTPIRIRDVARVTLGPALRRGALDDEGAPAVGGVVVARFGENPLAVIQRVKARLQSLQGGLPRRTLEDGTVSQVTVVPFYDRTTLIHETLDTLSSALALEILITVLVVLVMLRSLRSALLISALLPLGVLLTFVVMKLAGVDANIMALGGIAIAIGTMVDIGIVFVENMSQHLERLPEGAPKGPAVTAAAAEVAPAVLTSVATTVVSFLPVLGLSQAELRLFAPMALTKTFAMSGAFVLAALLLPSAATLVLSRPRAPRRSARWELVAAVLGVTWLLAAHWSPLGPGAGALLNLLFVGVLVGAALVAFRVFEVAYPALLATFLERKLAFLTAPAALTLFGTTAWLGFDTVFAFLPQPVRTLGPVSAVAHALPGFGREYMPPFDEGAFLYMPTTMPHASIGEVLTMLQDLDRQVAAIPEVDRVVGKLGRADSALDPAPLAMIETVITYKAEYGTDAEGNRVRQWRPHIRSPKDIWAEIVKAAEHPGLTSAPVLMPINARIVMLQSGMRAPMGIKIHGPTLEAIERFGLALEPILAAVPQVRAEAVFADRVVGKPYLEIEIDREAIGRYGLSITAVQDILQVALGGVTLTRTVEGRERYPVRVRYMREDRDSVEALQRVLVPTPTGEQIPLSQLATLRYVRGPQVIKSEDTFLTSFVLFDKREGYAEVETVEAAQAAIAGHIAAGDLVVPDGVRFEFAGTYENQVRSERRLMMLIPLALALVFVLLYLQFHRVAVTAIIYSGVVVAGAGGFLLLWLYGQPWFMNFSVLGTSMQDLFQIGPANISVAVWIGFIALIGVATDDGVVMSTYLTQRFREAPPSTVEEVRARTLEAGSRRVRPCLMTTATTLLALLPVITAQGRGADVMVPMALPSLGGMAVELMTLFVVPVLYAALEERRIRRNASNG
ncbi:MAG: efflux RND transporter permease subunit [Myxococcales bacterium]|nr:efflux RND transporter permease subunit [Myxococcales bacterium]